MEWKYVDLKELKNPLLVTDDMLSQWNVEFLDCNNVNREKYSYLLSVKERMINDAIILYKKDSNVVKYIKKQRIPKPCTRSFNDVKTIVLNARKEEEKKLKAFELEQKKDILIEKAITYLQDDGLKLGDDFTINDAISRANDIAFINEICKAQQEDGFFSFYGDDYCENCRGWDGSSHRCECGNRRVSWERDEENDFFIDPYIYGEAY